MGVGKEFKKKVSNFIKFDETGIIEGVFGGMNLVSKDVFGETKEVMRYKINGKTLDSQSGNLAEMMDAIPTGQKVRITKSGSGMQTKYKVEVIE